MRVRVFDWQTVTRSWYDVFWRYEARYEARELHNEKKPHQHQPHGSTCGKKVLAYAPEIIHRYIFCSFQK